MLKQMAANGLHGRLVTAGCPAGLAFMLANTAYKTRQGADVRQMTLELTAPGIGQSQVAFLVKQCVEGPLSLEQLISRVFGDNRDEALEQAEELDKLARFIAQQR
jgi:hypothetical protein